MPAAARRSLAPLAVLAMLAGPARATTFVGVSERILARAADAIGIGTVEQIETVAGADGLVVGDRPLRCVPLARLRRTLARAAAEDVGVAAAPLLATPPELLDPGLERAPVAEFTLMDSPPGRRFEADSGQPVVYQTA